MLVLEGGRRLLLIAHHSSPRHRRNLITFSEAKYLYGCVISYFLLESILFLIIYRLICSLLLLFVPPSLPSSGCRTQFYTPECFRQSTCFSAFLTYSSWYVIMHPKPQQCQYDSFMDLDSFIITLGCGVFIGSCSLWILNV